MSDPKPLANNNNAFGALPPRVRGMRARPAGTPALGGRTTIGEENIGDFFFIVPTDNAGHPGLEQPHKDQKVLGQLVSVITGGAIMPVPKFDVDGEMKFYPPNRYTFWTALWPVGARGGRRSRTQARKRRARSRKYTRRHRGGRKMHLPENSFVYKFMNMYNGLRPIDLALIDDLYLRERRMIRDSADFVASARAAFDADIAAGAFHFDDVSVTLGPAFSRYVQSNYPSTHHGYVMTGALLDYLHGYAIPMDGGRRHRGGRKMHLPENSFVYKFMNMYNGLRDIELDVIDDEYTRERRMLQGYGDFVNRANNFLEVDEASGAFRFDDKSVTLGPTFSRFIETNYGSSPYKYVRAGAMLDHLHRYGYHHD